MTTVILDREYVPLSEQAVVDRRAASVNVYLPPATDDDDELGRWFDSDLWSEVYAKERKIAEKTWFDWLLRVHRCPEMKDFSDILDWCIASERDEQQVEQKRNSILYLTPIHKANAAAIRGIRMSWSRIRQLVWERDGGICQVCRYKITLAEYDCGHIIDRLLGGSDKPCNLVCMCRVCNQLKPLTKTRAEYIEWASKGGPVREIMSSYFEARDAN